MMLPTILLPAFPRALLDREEAREDGAIPPVGVMLEFFPPLRLPTEERLLCRLRGDPRFFAPLEFAEFIKRFYYWKYEDWTLPQ